MFDQASQVFVSRQHRQRNPIGDEKYCDFSCFDSEIPLFLSIIINEIGVNYLVTNGGATGTSVMNFEKVLNLGKRR